MLCCVGVNGVNGVLKIFTSSVFSDFRRVWDLLSTCK